MLGHRKMVRPLNDKGFNVVRLPRADFAPFLVLGRSEGEMALLGTLTELMLEPPEDGLPELEPVEAVGFGDVSTGGCQGEAGLSLLDGVLERLGLGTVGASGRWTAAHEVELHYEQLELRQASMALVSRLLGQHPLDLDGPLLRPYLEHRRRQLFIVSAVLYSRRFEARIWRNVDGGGQVAVPLDELGLDVNLQAGGERARKHGVLHDGDPPMAVGFQCFKLDVDRKGRLELVNASARDRSFGSEDAPLQFSEGEEEAIEPYLLVEDDWIDLD